jgi:hypothetical protein
MNLAVASPHSATAGYRARYAEVRISATGVLGRKDLLLQLRHVLLERRPAGHLAAVAVILPELLGRTPNASFRLFPSR